jgi:asparagine synthase (glutamine-hydrolysing)
LQNSARLSVPGGASIACSTAKAVEWDDAWSKNLDPSGRAALGVHQSAYENQAASVSNTLIIDNVPLKMEVSTPGVAILS